MESQIVGTATMRADKALEAQLESSGQLTVREARGLSIENQQDYEAAGRFLVEIKARAKQVKDYWAQPKDAAKNAHQAIVDREKAMLAPLREAERVVKGSMVQYQRAVELARRQAQEEGRKRQQEEAGRLLQQAIDAQDSGNDHAAALNLAMAEMIDQMAPLSQIASPKAHGTSVSKTWKARVLDEKSVPSYFSGMAIRKVDLAVLNSIARMTKGTAKIPGVEFFEEMSISARS
ncbi:MAG: hypothetical protein DBY06_05940 [Clostridiales bacterium]|mgnify:CR=1 FL=1|nr:MAG: hypothetical protein DBY06_05940 [Clostridiales bacterium]